MFLLVLKDRECAESGVTKLVIKRLKGYESRAPVTDFCGAWSYRWLFKGGYGTITKCNKPSKQDVNVAVQNKDQLNI
jgi:hypothetical protein